MSASTRRVVTFPEPRTVEVIEEPIRVPGSTEVQVRTTFSAISPGTERLIYQGRVPHDIPADPTIDALEGGMTYPISYGYAAVGEVTAVGEAVNADWLGTRVFAFQPHASHFVASTEDLIPLPPEVGEKDGVMIPNLETAVNLLMDGQPTIGERGVIFGQGVVGLLTTALASRFPLEALYTVEPNPDRRARSNDWGADRSLDPSSGLAELRTEMGITSTEAVEADRNGYEGADLVFELSGEPAVLDDAISVTGFDGRIIVGSWYGSKQGRADFGSRFHRSRMELRASQVSTIDPRYRGRWTKERRMQTVLDLLKTIQPGDLVSDTFPHNEAMEAYRRLSEDPSGMLQPVFRYD